MYTMIDGPGPTMHSASFFFHRSAFVLEMYMLIVHSNCRCTSLFEQQIKRKRGENCEVAQEEKWLRLTANRSFVTSTSRSDAGEDYGTLDSSEAAPHRQPVLLHAVDCRGML